MNLPISDRLFACCAYIAKGDRVADIGCDHGYLGIHLLLNNIASFVIAADINPQPLDSAKRNASKFGVTDRMSFHLSNGANNLPRDFDTLVCAGMGADTIVSILSGAPWLQSEGYRLILQCQSKTPMLRQYLSENGWHIAEETVLRDGKFLYTVMNILWQPGHCLTVGERYFSPALLIKPSPVAAEYYRQVIAKLQRAVDGRGDCADPTHITALSELRALADNPATMWLKEDRNDNCK